VASLTADKVIITPDGKIPEGKKKIKHDPAQGCGIYPLRKFMRSNAATCINQKVLVSKGDAVKKGQVIVDGPCTYGGNWLLAQRTRGVHALERL